MREAVGGALLLYLIIPIFIIIIFFVSFIMKYASAYRAANYVVSRIEVCQADGQCENEGAINSVLASQYGYVNGYDDVCIPSGDKSYHRVTLYVGFDLPIVEYINVFRVTAETKSLLGPCS